ncbi:MAG: D-alanine--D-alanine ligase [Cytophagales bacterium]|nr:D-alanine--D-alanine ligase [Bernardetiaceae bacterium]MDW8210230.1 D-alanine--D-alanine ligase [Cytophagales bacterium]
MRVGIFFGGPSREREISFAGGKTVYYHLDRTLFEPVPVFVDSLGNFIITDKDVFDYQRIWDFYPTESFIKKCGKSTLFKIYAESLGKLSAEQLIELTNTIGQPVLPHDFKKYFDFAFLALHGLGGEDGSLQGLLEWYGIPYSAPGIFGSAVGIDKTLQNELIQRITGVEKHQMTIRKATWDTEAREELFERVKSFLGLPFVVKAPHGGSSIGMAVVREDDLAKFIRSVEQCFFRLTVTKSQWAAMNRQAKIDFVQKIAYVEESIGYPVVFEADSLVDKGEIVYFHPQDLLDKLEDYFSYSDTNAILTSVHSESSVLIEAFIEGKEFSCGVIQDQEDRPIALPPTGIEYCAPTFDFQAKYQSPTTRKKVPVEVPLDQLREIHRQVKAVSEALRFGVCVRIDGFARPDGSVALHDPNTIPGMSPTSLIFKQMAEIGLNTTQSLTYLIRASLQDRCKTGKNTWQAEKMLARLDWQIDKATAQLAEKPRVAILFGGFLDSNSDYSFSIAQRLYAQITSEGKYYPILVLLSGSPEKHVLHQIPINLFFRENISVIKQNLYAEKHPFIVECINQAEAIIAKYAGYFDQQVRQLSYEDLARSVVRVYIATYDLPAGTEYSPQTYLQALELEYIDVQPENFGIFL